MILNGTQDHNGNYRSLYTEELYANRKLLDDVYLNELAYGARELGYEIEPTEDGFELAEYNKEIRDTFSQRRKAIESHVAEQVESGAVAAGRLYQQAALKTRNRKREVDRETLLEDWETVLSAKQLTLPAVPAVDEERDLTISGQIQSIVAAHDGIHHAEERESVFKRGKVERFALEHHCGLQSWKHLQTAISNTQQLIRVDAVRDRYTTQTAIDRERETVQLMQRGQGKMPSIADRERVTEIAPNTLTSGQRAALELSVTTTDQTIAWQGIAGAGKSYALNLYRQLAIEAGYAVRGFAPSAAAATVLSEEAGMPSDTVASLLNSKIDPRRSHTSPEIWVIDEAGLLSAKDAHALLKRATTQNARVLLVGDTKQLSAVEAGNPFKSLQQHGIGVAHLEESRRQKENQLKMAVDAISKGDLNSGFYHLDQGGSIRSVETSEARVSQVVEDYLALSAYQRSRTLIVANTNTERRSITEGIRAGLQAERNLGDDTFTMTSLKPHDWTISEAKYAKRYEPGDVIVPTQDYRKQQLVKGQQYAVVAIDEAQNRLTVEAIDGQRWEIDPGKCDRKTVYKTEAIPLAPGDSLRWTKNDRSENRRNGQEFTIEGLDDRGRAIVRNKDDKTDFIDLSGRQFADYALVSTTYAAQGKTADRILAALDGTTAKESFYVASSRARLALALYTTDAAQLRQLAARSRANENASDYVNLFTYENHYAQNQTRSTETPTRRPEDTPTDDRADRGISIGSCVASRLAAALQRDSRVETSSSDLGQCLEDFNRANPVSGIETDAIADTLADLVERRTIVRSGPTIATALERIALHLNQLERVSQQLESLCHEFAERDREFGEEAVIETVPEVVVDENIDIDAIIAATAAMDAEDLFAAMDAEYDISMGDAILVHEDNFSGEILDPPIPNESPSSLSPQAPTLPISAEATEIIAIATRLFEYYVEQGEIEVEADSSPQEWVYEINTEERVYWLSWDQSTGECNVRGTSDLDVRLDRGITEQDIEIWRNWNDWLDQQAISVEPSENVATASTTQSESVEALPEVPLTLETAAELTAPEWLALTPRQQLNLAIAARQHRATEPQGYTRSEQWTGQRSGLEQQIKELKRTEHEARTNLKELEERGERSLFNPLGVSWERLHDARDHLRDTRAARKQAEGDLKEIDKRHLQRQQQDAARQEWNSLPCTQGAHQILALLGQPDLEAQFQAVERTYQQLNRWAAIVQSTPQEAEVRSTVTAYLDGRGLSQQSRQRMQHDLAQAQQKSHQLEL